MSFYRVGITSIPDFTGFSQGLCLKVGQPLQGLDMAAKFISERAHDSTMVLDVKPEGLVIAAHFQSMMVNEIIPFSDASSQRLMKAGVLKIEIPPRAKQEDIKSLLTITTADNRTIDALTKKGIRADLKTSVGWQCVNVNPKENIQDQDYAELFHETLIHDAARAYKISNGKEIVDYLWMFMEKYEYLASCVQEGRYSDDPFYSALDTMSIIRPLFANIHNEDCGSPFKDIAFKANNSYSKLIREVAGQRNELKTIG